MKQTVGTGARRGAAALVFVGLLPIAAGACGSTSAGDAAPASSDTVAAAPAVPSPETRGSAGRIEDPVIAPSDFSGPAVDRFGADQVDAAYRQVVEFAAATTFDEHLLTPREDRTPEDFAGVTEYMTSTTAAQFSSQLPGAIEHNVQAGSAVLVVSWYDVSGEDLSLASSGPLVVNHSISGLSAAVTEDGRMAFTYTQSGDLRVVLGGVPSLMTMSKTVTVTVVPGQQDSERPWLIDGVTGTWEIDDPVVELSG